MYDGEEQLQKANEFNKKCLRAYHTLQDWVDRSDADYDILDEDPAVIRQEAMAIDKSEVQRREDAKADLLEAERNYLAAVEKAEREVEWP
jgi:uncharacterized protein YqeY